MPEQRYPKVRPWLYRATNLIMRGLAWLLVQRLTVEGQENVPPEGPFVVAINHLSYLDSPVIFLALPRTIYFLAGERYSQHIFGPILRVAGAIFVQRGEVDREALRQSMAALQDGHCLVVAIEGTRSKTGGLIPPKTGAAYLATRADVPILPAVIWGTEKVGSRWRHLRRGGEIRVRFGPLFRLPEGHARSADLETYSDEIMTTLAAMLPPSYRGVYLDHPRVAQKVAAAGVAASAGQ